jgi:predicted nuclease of predicted toxin-antitoxin system
VPAVWVDAQLVPALAKWMREGLGINAVAVRDLRLRQADDQEIFERVRTAGAVVLSTDSDFAELVMRHGPPPQIIWLTCGNTTNAYPRTLFTMTWPRVAALLDANEPLIEVGGTAFEPDVAAVTATEVL